MKVKINLSGFEFFPDYFTKLLGVIHKWLGDNNIHDTTSLYTFSIIRHNYFTFTSFDSRLQIDLLKGAINNEKMFKNVVFIGFERMHINTNKNIFSCASPFFVKNKAQKHLIFKDAEQRAIEILITKSKIAGIKLGEFDLEFVDFVKTKLIRIHDIDNKCFVSKIKITGSKEMKKFACQVGIGSSTGSGFGMIY